MNLWLVKMKWEEWHNGSCVSFPWSNYTERDTYVVAYSIEEAKSEALGSTLTKEGAERFADSTICWEVSLVSQDVIVPAGSYR